MSAAPEAVKEPPAPNEETDAEISPRSEQMLELPIKDILIGTNIRQPDPEQLKELVSSIKEHGVLEPVLIARRNGGLELVARFRRTAAAKKAGLATIPARVLDVTPSEVVEIQLTENLQREDLSELEEARAFKDYVDAGHSQGDLAKRIGKSQPYVSNRMRLLGLPEPVQRLVSDGKLTSSHAEVLLQIPKEADENGEYSESVAKLAVKDSVPVDQLQRVVSRDLEAWRKAQAIEKKAAASKFPVCPTCKKPPTTEGYGGTVGHGDYSQHHQWSLKTSKTEVQREKEEQERWAKQTASRASSRSRPPPKQYHREAAATTRSAHTPYGILQALLKQVGEKGVALIEIERDGSRGFPVIRFAVSEGSLPLAPKDASGHYLIRAVPYSSGEASQIVAVELEPAKRRSATHAFESWEKKTLPARSVKAKPRVYATEILVGDVGTVNARLRKQRGDHELLEVLRDTEVESKNRGSVLDTIDDMLGTQNHGSYQSQYYNRGALNVVGRPAIYARVSTREQSTDGQVERLGLLCASRDWKDPLIFRDDGISGVRDNRPQLDDLRKRMLRGDLSAVVVSKMDRLGRSVGMILRFWDEAESAGVKVVVADQGIDTSTPGGRLQRTMLAAIAEFERELILERTQDGIDRARAAGKRFGRPPKITDDQRAECVQRLTNGESSRDVSQALKIPASTVRWIWSRARMVTPSPGAPRAPRDT